MKKIKYRNNNYNNQVYSINYKFDSVSPAGKCTGTALDLIKKYNELAKEANSNGNYVEAEVFRQYAEHYRKIVTDINERKNSRFNNNQDAENQPATEENQQPVEKNESAEAPAAQTAAEQQEPAAEKALIEPKPKTARKSFKVIEVADKAASRPKQRTKKVENPSQD